MKENNLIYDKNYFDSLESFEAIFNYALELLKNKKIDEAKRFYTAYIQYLYDSNPRDKVTSLEHATECAGKNFGYWAGYFGVDVRKLIKKHFGAIHPIFGDRYDITPAEAFQMGYVRGKSKLND